MWYSFPEKSGGNEEDYFWIGFSVYYSLFVGCKDSSNTKKLLFIDVTLSPTDYVFSVGDNVKDHLIVKGYYSDGTVETITDYSTDIETVTSDTKSVTVTYGSKTKTIPISVSGSLGTLMSIEVLSLPKRLNYTEKSLFDDSGLVVVGVYSDGSKRVITDYTLSLKNGESVGTVDSGDKKTIINTVTYNGDSSITTSFEITIKKLSSYTLIKQTDWCSSVDYKNDIEKIVFDYTDNLPSNIKDIILYKPLTLNPIGNTNNDLIYLIEEGTELYVFSDGLICGNSNCSDMFNGFLNLKEITFNNFDSSNVTNMKGMFMGCSKLSSLDLCCFDTTNVTNMNFMFVDCTSLETLNVSSFVTTDVTEMNSMFYNCSSLTSLDLRSFDTTNVTDKSEMFKKCGKEGTTVTINPTYENESFFNGTELSDWIYTSTTDLGTYQKVMKYTMKKEDSWLPSSVTIGIITDIVFDYTDNLPQNIKDNLTTSTSVGNTDDDLIYLMVDGTELYIFSDGIICGNSDCSEMFKGFRNNEITFNSFNTSNVTNMSYMFYGCTHLTSLDLSCFDTSNVKGMNGMFNSCGELTSITFGDKFVTSKVTDMSDMFSNCYNLQSITFGDNFDTSNVTYMSYMFYKCKGLKTLDLSNFDTSNITDMSYMFDDCNQLTSVKINPSIEINKTNFGGVLSDFTLSGDTYTKNP